MANLVLLFLVCIAQIFADDSQELGIEKVSVPEKCERLTKKHDIVKMHYTGHLTDGTKFDSSLDHGEPFQFQLGIGQVIKGWEEGLLDMCVGEKRKLTIPPHLGYGDKAVGDKIPASATLLFEVELLSVEEGEKPDNVFKMIDADNDNNLTPDEVSLFMKNQAKEGGEEIELESQEHQQVVQSIFEYEDKDKDGVISFEEFSGPKHDEL